MKISTNQMLRPRLLLSILALRFISARSSACNSTCGPRTVPYPFGFSHSCGIPLNCSAGAAGAASGSPEVQIGGFAVRNISAAGILIDVPPACERTINASIAAFFGRNYAMTWKNVLLVRNCSGNVTGCEIPTALLSQQLDLGTCGAQGDSISCLSGGAAAAAAGFLDEANLTAAGCGLLFTSIGYESGGEAEFLPSIAFRTVELGWWLEGKCQCGPGANCTRVKLPATGKMGFRCECGEGLEGDGFKAGSGCRKATIHKCNPSKYLSGTCGSGTGRVGVLIGGIIAGASVMAGLTLACCLIRRRSSSRKSIRTTRRMLSQASCTVPLYPYKDIERATNFFSDDQRLGTGAYGTVYAGKLNDDKLVAIKKIKNRDVDGIEQVMNEIKLLSSVSHPNLVRLLGCCVEPGEQILVYEFMANGTLSQHLQRELGPALPWTIRLSIAAETANAIAYLHTAISPPIYHRDIKTSNILLDYSFSSKVADFGLSRMGLTDSSHISTAPQGTPGYVDPQYHQNFHLSDKSDVYSFGVVLAEIITGMKAVDFKREQSEVNLASLVVDKIGKGCIDEIVDPYLEMQRDAWMLSSLHKVGELAFRCLAFHQDMRPSMVEVADELEQVRLSGWAPQDEMFVSPASSLRSSASNGGGRRLFLGNNTAAEVVKLDSPVSVHDPWFSEQSSPSSNSLLGSAVQ